MSEKVRCPGCNRYGSKALDGYCKACFSKKPKLDEPALTVVNVCTKCGEPAFKFLEVSPYHSWYCEEHYNEKLEEFDEKREYIIKDNVKASNTFFKGKFIPLVDQPGIVKKGYGYETG